MKDVLTKFFELIGYFIGYAVVAGAVLLTIGVLRVLFHFAFR